MVTKEQSLQNFIQKADEVITGGILFASNKIMNLLLTISSSQILYDVASYCMEYENKSDVMSRCFSVRADGKGDFIMPDAAPLKVAIGMFLFMEYFSEKKDGNNKLEFTEFLSKFFCHGDNYDEYFRSFVRSVVEPFRDAFAYIVDCVIQAKDKWRDDIEDSGIEATELDYHYLYGVAEALEEDLASMREGGAEGTELYNVIEDMIADCRTKRVDRLKALFIAYKSTHVTYKKIKFNYDTVEAYLKDHHVLESK